MSLCDGLRTCEEIRREFTTQVGLPLPMDEFQSLLEHLEAVCFLEGPGFNTYYNSLLAEYRRNRLRPQRHPEALGFIEGQPAPFAAMLAGDHSPALTSPIRGLIAPHLDYDRGRPCYSAAYSALQGQRTPNRVVVLGTNHFGRATAATATSADFQTPFGVTRTDREFLARLGHRCGDLCAFELDHLREHSVELQVAWLQYLFGAEAFKIVAVLCPDPCGHTGTAPRDGQGVDLREFAAALRETIDEDPQGTLVVAGADFSHVGESFGDKRPLDQGFLDEVRHRDQRALDRLLAGDAEGFRNSVAQDENPTRVCSAGCVFALALALAGRQTTLLGYHQAVDLPAQTCVTCAAVALY